jgi:hypothetical protein
VGLNNMFARERQAIEQATEAARDGISLTMLIAGGAILLAVAALAVALLKLGSTMPELKTPDGTPVDLQVSEIEFAKAMSTPVSDVPAPPKITEADKAEVEKARAEPRRRGRPPKADRARIEPVKDNHCQDHARAGQDAT